MSDVSELPGDGTGRLAIRTAEAAPPAGPYSQGLMVDRLLFASGQGPFDRAGNRVGTTFAEQANQVFDNLEAVANEAGARLRDAVKLGVFLTDLSDFAELNRVVAARFGPVFPARTTIQTPLPGFAIEVDAVFLVPRPSAGESS